MAIVDFTKSGRTDATLVQAAQNAAMAGVPKDLTKIFDGIADHYEKGMTQLGAGLAKAAEVAVEAGGMLGEKMMERRKRRDAGENINDGFTEQFTGQLDFIKDIKNNAGAKSFIDGKGNVLEFTAPPSSDLDRTVAKFNISGPDICMSICLFITISSIPSKALPA